jgi:SulP family sulfate permease
VLFFGSAPPLDRKFVEELASHPQAERLVVDLQRLGRIDYTGAVGLLRLSQDAERAGLEVRVTGVPAHTGGLLPRVFGTDSPFLDPTRPPT